MTDLDYLKKYYQGDLNEALKKLEAGIPVQYIVGNVEFYDLTLKVNSNVLIPRFETEELVDKVIKMANSFVYPRIADIGTGSGAIALTLKKHLNCEMVATDISLEALKVAQINAKENALDIEFKEGNLLEPLVGKFDIIVSNPPYIAYDEEIMDIVKNNEPHLALYAKNSGLYYYEKMLKNIQKYMNKGGLVAFEIGANQGEALKRLSRKYLNREAIIEKDMQNRERFLFINF